MRVVISAVFILASCLSLTARQQTGTSEAKQPAATDKSNPPATTDNNAETKPAMRVFLTRRKAWLASGGFTANGEIGNSQGIDFTKDFHKGCPKPLITDKQDTADYAVTIDEMGLIDSLTTTDDALVAAIGTRATCRLLGSHNFIASACAASPPRCHLISLLLNRNH